jgi:hypothetical protein
MESVSLRLPTATGSITERAIFLAALGEDTEVLHSLANPERINFDPRT